MQPGPGLQKGGNCSFNTQSVGRGRTGFAGDNSGCKAFTVTVSADRRVSLLPKVVCASVSVEAALPGGRIGVGDKEQTKSPQITGLKRARQSELDFK